MVWCGVVWCGVTHVNSGLSITSRKHIDRPVRYVGEKFESIGSVQTWLQKLTVRAPVDLIINKTHKPLCRGLWFKMIRHGAKEEH